MCFFVCERLKWRFCEIVLLLWIHAFGKDKLFLNDHIKTHIIYALLWLHMLLVECIFTVCCTWKMFLIACISRRKKRKKKRKNFLKSQLLEFMATLAWSHSREGRIVCRRANCQKLHNMLGNMQADVIFRYETSGLYFSLKKEELRKKCLECVFGTPTARYANLVICLKVS